MDNNKQKIWLAKWRQTIFILLAIIIGFGGIFYYNYYQKKVEQKRALAGQLDVSDVDKYFKNTPERPTEGSVLPPDNVKNVYLNEIDISQKAIANNTPSKSEYKNLKDDYFNIAHAYDILAKYQEAEIAYKKIFELWPDDYKTMINLSNLYLMMGQYKDSATLLYKVINIYPKEAEGYIRLANLYSRYSSDVNKADNIYSMGIATVDNKLDITKEYAYYLERVKKDYTQAIIMWREYEKISGSKEQKEIDRLQGLIDLK